MSQDTTYARSANLIAARELTEEQFEIAKAIVHEASARDGIGFGDMGLTVALALTQALAINYSTIRAAERG